MNILTNIIDLSTLLMCVIISFISFLITIIIISIPLLGVFQYEHGIMKVNIILNQFIENIPVAGSNTENKFIIIFSLLDYFLIL
jgi:hypothetical protein